MSVKHKERLRKLILNSGGEIEDSIYVTKPGIRLLAATELTPSAREVFDEMNIDGSRPEYERMAEFNSRITYLSFRDEPKSSEDFNRKMVEEYGHLSVHSAYNATFLLAGVAMETCLEVIAHNEANVARLTSSRTKAMDETLYRISGDEEAIEIQKKEIVRIRNFRERGHVSHELKDDPDLDHREWLNRLNIGCKAVALTCTMNIKDYHKTFIGRLSHHGVETGMREVCEGMCEILHRRYPLVIQEPSHYYELNNAEKYQMEG